MSEPGSWKWFCIYRAWNFPCYLQHGGIHGIDTLTRNWPLKRNSQNWGFPPQKKLNNTEFRRTRLLRNSQKLMQTLHGNRRIWVQFSIPSTEYGCNFQFQARKSQNMGARVRRNAEHHDVSCWKRRTLQNMPKFWQYGKCRFGVFSILQCRISAS